MNIALLLASFIYTTNVVTSVLGPFSELPATGVTSDGKTVSLLACDQATRESCNWFALDESDRPVTHSNETVRITGYVKVPSGYKAVYSEIEWIPEACDIGPWFSNRVARISQVFEKRTSDGTARESQLSIYRWYLWKAGAEGNRADITFNRNHDRQGMWSGKAFVGPGTSVEVLMQSDYDGTDTWWTPTIVLPESMGGGTQVLDPFKGLTHTYELGSPFGTVTLMAQNYYPYWTEGDVEDAMYMRITQSENWDWDRTTNLVEAVSNALGVAKRDKTDRAVYSSPSNTVSGQQLAVAATDSDKPVSGKLVKVNADGVIVKTLPGTDYVEGTTEDPAATTVTAGKAADVVKTKTALSHKRDKTDRAVYNASEAAVANQQLAAVATDATYKPVSGQLVKVDANGTLVKTIPGTDYVVGTTEDPAAATVTSGKAADVAKTKTALGHKRDKSDMAVYNASEAAVANQSLAVVATDSTYKPVNGQLVKVNASGVIVKSAPGTDYVVGATEDPAASTVTSGKAADVAKTKTALGTKVDKVTAATADRIATFVSGGNIKDSGKVLADYVPWVVDSASAKTAVTVGTRSDTVGARSLVNGTSCTASGTDSHAEGNYAQAKGNYSHASGNYARTGTSSASHARAFCWQGASGTSYYDSKGDGTFNINPQGGIDGFWIGSKTLRTHIVENAPGGGGDGTRAMSALTNANGVGFAEMRNFDVTVGLPGESWTDYPHTSAPGLPLFVDIVYGNGVLAGASFTDGGGLWRSVDGGKHWAQSQVVDNGEWSVAYGNGVFVAALTRGSYVAVSTDGWTWYLHDLSSSGFSDFGVISFVIDRFYVGDSNTRSLHESVDGVTWNTLPGTQLDSGRWNNINYADGLYVAGIEEASSIMVSADLVNWELIPYPYFLLSRVRKFNGVYVGVDYKAGPVWSNDGRSWNLGYDGYTASFSLVESAGRLFAGGDRLMMSEDGRAWTPISQTMFPGVGNIPGGLAGVRDNPYESYRFATVSHGTATNVVPVVQGVYVNGDALAMDTNNCIRLDSVVTGIVDGPFPLGESAPGIVDVSSVRQYRMADLSDVNVRDKQLAAGAINWCGSLDPAYHRMALPPKVAGKSRDIVIIFSVETDVSSGTAAFLPVATTDLEPWSISFPATWLSSKIYRITLMETRVIGGVSKWEFSVMEGYR